MPEPFRSRSEFRNCYENEAKNYDAVRGDTPDGALIAAMEADFLQKSLEIGIKSEASVLEVGCGTGRILLELAERGIKCFGIDPAKNMISELSTKHDTRFPQLKRHLCVGEMENIPFANNTFDGVYTVNVLQWLPGHYTNSVVEMHRVVKRGGRIIMDFPNRFSFWRTVKKLIVPFSHERNKTFKYSELKNNFDELSKGQYEIESRFSYPQRIYRYSFFRYLAPLIENKMGMPFRLRGKFFVIITKR